MNNHEITTIGRSLNFGYFTNKLIIIIAVLTFIIYTTISLFNAARGETNYTSLTTGIKAGLLVFFLWAISRELDPDKERGAFVTVFLALAFMMIFEIPSILPFVWFLLILRTVNHSSGMPAGIMDSLLTAIIGTILAYYMSWIYGILTAVGFIIDSRLNAPAKHHLPIGVLMLIISAIVCVENREITFAYSYESILFVVFGTVMFLPVIIWPGKLESVGDRTNEPLDPARIKMARIIGILVFLGMGTAQHEINLALGAFVFCIFAGIGAYSIVSGILLHSDVKNG
ncbi:hypothetical protein RE476_11710 [Methanolobus mangrovi]|uniref:Uncharacterized protein n=1 Tax=Methanolobus mangrovi TaxID=3072977 RepID=A0AA51YIY3_9EURY|nr:hypothetical protein [Methanolobus mangrovi]WMW22023.1 hypothetical protein RE476_11710 [Methanolobus mangrovi]